MSDNINNIDISKGRKERQLTRDDNSDFTKDIDTDSARGGHSVLVKGNSLSVLVRGVNSVLNKSAKYI